MLQSRELGPVRAPPPGRWPGSYPAQPAPSLAPSVAQLEYLDEQKIVFEGLVGAEGRWQAAINVVNQARQEVRMQVYTLDLALLCPALTLAYRQRGVTVKILVRRDGRGRAPSQLPRTGAEVRASHPTARMTVEWVLGDHRLFMASGGLTAAGVSEARELGNEKGPVLLLLDRLREECAASFDDAFSLGERVAETSAASGAGEEVSDEQMPEAESDEGNVWSSLR